MKSENKIKSLLRLANIDINGKNPGDIQVHNKKLYNKILAQGSMGLGESYMDKWWDCNNLDIFFDKILRAKIEKKIRGIPMIWLGIKAYFLNLQTKTRSLEVGKKHYDAGNDLYRLMLDKRMNYSCAYWKNAKTLDKAQEDKLDLICKKLQLKKGEKVLDIGCGWGSFAKFAAQKYKVKVTGITISKEQAKLAKEVCKGLDIDIRLQDYRKLNEKFDKIVSIGMFEHVGVKNYKTYMKTVSKNLKENGLFLLHTIGRNTSVITTDPWFNKYIFPNSMLPSLKQISKASESIFILEDWHSFGPDYDKTLMEWHNNFNKNWDKIKHNYDERFKRMWNYYLMASAGSFRARRNQLWQIVFSKNIRSYNSIR